MTGWDARAEMLAESNTDLVRLIYAEIIAAPQQRITFARFMQQALGHPEFGYYSTTTARPGYDGDFLTAPETHPIFGWALARQVTECWERLGRPADFTVRECGAGSGTLALTILQGLHREFPLVLESLRYELEDISSERGAAVAVALRADQPDLPVYAASAGPITGLVIANELLDALPVHRLIVQGGDLQERWVAWRDGWFADEVGPLSDPALAESVRGLPLEEGQALEVSPAVQAWAADLPQRLERGYAILIDYGDAAVDLYDPQRGTEGTVRTYVQHEVGDDPYRRVGVQDLTAHVDFTAVERAAVDSDPQQALRALGLISQAFFFAGLAIQELLLQVQQDATTAEDYLPARNAVLTLLDPGTLGNFRVLGLARNVEATPPLKGFSFIL